MAGYRLAGVVMRSVLLAVCTIAAAVTTQAQITTGHWYNGSLVYSASDAGGSKILMSATAEGEELEFMLLPDMTSGETGTYRVGKGPNDYEMEYDYATHSYQATVMLKMGYYSYQYLILDDEGNTHVMPTEGNFFQTENQYQALVYYREPGGRTDQLVGYQQVTYK